MGNSSDGLELQTSISREQFLLVSSYAWSQRESCLYFSQIPKNPSQFLVKKTQLKFEDEVIRQYFEKLKMMQNYLHNGNLQLPLLITYEPPPACSCSSNQTAVNFYYQKFDVTLGRELKTRIKIRKNFTQQQIWYILYQLLNSLRRFQPFYQKSGAINLEAILINSLGGIKLINTLTSPYSLQCSDFLSPEQLQILKYSHRSIIINTSFYVEAKINPNIAQTFSAGIVILAIMSLVLPQQFYIFGGMGLNTPKIEQTVKDLKRRGYSRLLCNMLITMLSNYRNRPLPSQIYQTFHKYEQNILNFFPFKFTPEMTPKIL